MLRKKKTSTTVGKESYFVGEKKIIEIELFPCFLSEGVLIGAKREPRDTYKLFLINGAYPKKHF